MKQDKQRILIIIPAYNEALSILSTYQQVSDFNKDWDIIVVNDGSTDKTLEVCKENHIPCINLVSNLGVGGAVQTGYKYALYHNYDIAVQFDGDGQHNADFIPQLIAPITQGSADFSIGSRFLDDQKDGFRSSWNRRLGIIFISKLLKTLTRLTITDPTSGFRAANRDVMELFSVHYPTEYPEPSSIVLLYKYKLTVKEVPVLMNMRLKGFSSIQNWRSVYYMINVSLLIVLLSFTRFKNLKH